MILNWDTYFMNIAILASLRSKDTNTQVGSVLVSEDHKILGTGYNGLPTGIDESQFPTNRDGALHQTKYGYVIHAELNAILNSNSWNNIKNSTLYVTLFPCNECAKIITQCGIREIIYLSDKYPNEPAYIASRKILDVAGIKYKKYNGDILINAHTK